MDAAAGVADHLHHRIPLGRLVGGKALHPLSGPGAAKEKCIHQGMMRFGLAPNKSRNIPCTVEMAGEV